MTKIHGIAYVVIGLGIAVQAYFIDYDKLFIFFWIGLGLIAFGAGKIAFWYIMREGKEEKTKEAPAVQKAVHLTQHPATQKVSDMQIIQHAPKPAHAPHIQYCPYCGTPVLPHHTFCVKCGRKIE